MRPKSWIGQSRMSWSAALTLTGTFDNIETFLNDTDAVTYTGASNASGNNAATLTVTANDDDGPELTLATQTAAQAAMIAEKCGPAHSAGSGAGLCKPAGAPRW